MAKGGGATRASSSTAPNGISKGSNVSLSDYKSNNPLQKFVDSVTDNLISNGERMWYGGLSDSEKVEFNRFVTNNNDTVNKILSAKIPNPVSANYSEQSTNEKIVAINDREELVLRANKREGNSNFTVLLRNKGDFGGYATLGYGVTAKRGRFSNGVNAAQAKASALAEAVKNYYKRKTNK